MRPGGLESCRADDSREAAAGTGQERSVRECGIAPRKPQENLEEKRKKTKNAREFPRRTPLGMTAGRGFIECRRLTERHPTAFSRDKMGGQWGRIFCRG